jgi:hypothetical protein
MRKSGKMKAINPRIELNHLIEMLPAKKLGRAKDMILALMNDKIIKDGLSDEDIREIQQGIEDTKKGDLYSVQDAIAEYKAKRKKNR